MTTPESIKSAIETGLACERVEVSGDGQHFQALIVSKAFDAAVTCHRCSLHSKSQLAQQVSHETLECTSINLRKL